MEEIPSEFSEDKNEINDTAKYQICKQKLRPEQYQVDIILKPSVHPSWINPIKKAIYDINTAAPGIKLKLIGRLGEVERLNDTITIWGEEIEEEGTYTEGNVISHDHCEITLNDHWDEECKNGTALHEMLHAIGLEHEHQRHDAAKYVDINYHDVPDGELDQYQPVDENYALSRFDPFSVMMYPCYRVLVPKRNGDSIWKLKVNNDQCQELSELDKVGINSMIAPAGHGDYEPRISSLTGLYYCGRPVMSFKHSNISENEVQVKCGPNKGPNCPACRVLNTQKIDEIINIGKWQGWTGYVYCGKRDAKGEIMCGLDNGNPCVECYNLLYPKPPRLPWLIMSWIDSKIKNFLQSFCDIILRFCK